jgi:hypothetical protein
MAAFLPIHSLTLWVRRKPSFFQPILLLKYYKFEWFAFPYSTCGSAYYIFLITEAATGSFLRMHGNKKDRKWTALPIPVFFSMI